VQLRK